MAIKRVFNNDKLAISTDEIDTVFVSNIADNTSLSIQVQDGFFTTIYSEEDVPLSAASISKDIEIIDLNEEEEIDEEEAEVISD